MIVRHTHASKKGSEKEGSQIPKRALQKVLRRVLRRGPAMDFTVKRGSEEGSQKGF